MTALVEGYEVVIGIETHVQLATNSKIFSRASTTFGAVANTQVAPLDVALPGTLPVMNREAVACAIRFGLAVGAQISEKSVFARKNYFYPDLPKGYQISQFEIPVVVGGSLPFELVASGKGQKPPAALQTRNQNQHDTQHEPPVSHMVRLVRAHLEEDAGKSLHDVVDACSGIDLNRAGSPLLEIVTEPDMRSSAEAVAYAKELHRLVTWLGISDGNMQEGNFRCDANVSVRKPHAPLGTRREIKNLNSFRFLQQAVDYEVRWQIDQLEAGRAITQATVLFDAATGTTRVMRTKEDAADYRYFPDPDLPPLIIEKSWVDAIRAQQPELPTVRAKRFVRQYGMEPVDAANLVVSRNTADYFEAVALCGNAKLACNWVLGDVAKYLNAHGLDIARCPVSAVRLCSVLRAIEAGQLKNHAARAIFARWCEQAGAGRAAANVDAGETAACETLEEAAQQLGFILAHPAGSVRQAGQTGQAGQSGQSGQSTQLDQMALFIPDVLATNAKSVAEFLAGKEKALNALVGQVMKKASATGTRLDPSEVMQALRLAIDADHAKQNKDA